MTVQSAFRRLYVIKLPNGQSVFCPAKDKPIKASSCIECEWNPDRKIHPLPSDELRGVGYVACVYRAQ